MLSLSSSFTNQIIKYREVTFRSAAFLSVQLPLRHGGPEADYNLPLCTLSRFTDIYNISKPTFRSCSILVAILYTSFRHAVPIFRFVSIFLIRVGAVNYQYIQRPRRKARTARRAGGGERLGMHRLSMQRLMSL